MPDSTVLRAGYISLVVAHKVLACSLKNHPTTITIGTRTKFFISLKKTPRTAGRTPSASKNRKCANTTGATA